MSTILPLDRPPATGTPVTPAPVPPDGRWAPATLIADGVSAWLGARKILERISLVMAAGRVTALIGPSGGGKSTFLRTLNRLHELVPGAALSGSVRLDGVDIYGDGLKATETRRRIGMIFPKPSPFPAMTIAENVLAGFRIAGLKVHDQDQVVEESLRRAGLWNECRARLNSPGGALSSGQQQRLCIARALAVKPQVLLMDEPCSALDPTSAAVIEETIAELAHEVTVVLVTHNLQQAQRISHDCAVLMAGGEDQPGRIVEAGPTVEIFANPRDRRTADYVHGRFG